MATDSAKLSFADRINVRLPLVVFIITVLVRLAFSYLYIADNVQKLHDRYTSGQPVPHTAAGEHILLPNLMAFTLLPPSKSAATWKEALYYRKYFKRSDAAGGEGQGLLAALLQRRDSVPLYLQAVAPLYSYLLPTLLLSTPAAILFLSVCDGVTAALIATFMNYKTGRSGTKASAAEEAEERKSQLEIKSFYDLALYVGFVFNPWSLISVAHQSLGSLEWLLLALVLYLCQYDRRYAQTADPHRHHPVAYTLAFATSLVLGSPYVAVPVALLVPFGGVVLPCATDSEANRAYGAPAARRRRALRHFLPSALLICAVGGYAVAYLFGTRAVEHHTALFAPLDAGPRSYVAQLVLPSFGRCLQIFYVQVPAILTVYAAWAFPRSEKVVHAYNVAHPRHPLAFHPLYHNGRVQLVLFAMMTSLLFSPEWSYLAPVIMTLLVYSHLHCRASRWATKPLYIYQGMVKKLFKKGNEEYVEEVDASTGKVVLRELKVYYPAHKRIRAVVVIYTILFSITTQFSFYIPNFKNFNWLFFAETAFAIGCAIFCAQWVLELTKDAILLEQAVEHSVAAGGKKSREEVPEKVEDTASRAKKKA